MPHSGMPLIVERRRSGAHWGGITFLVAIVAGLLGLLLMAVIGTVTIVWAASTPSWLQDGASPLWILATADFVLMFSAISPRSPLR
ncbi:MAG TPA: hypothetical protein VEY07_03715 [Thermoplasmata archaeon]|nr:hypothetical protein [Thermoplasmata archaeon]